MKGVNFPAGYSLETLRRDHSRKQFRSGQRAVDNWLVTKALQSQTKHLSSTKVLTGEDDAIAGFYTLAPSQIDFSELPVELSRSLPQRLLPVAQLAWLGVDTALQGQGLGSRLLAQALRDCWEASRVFPFVLILLDCIDEQAKKFYEHFGFAQLPGQPYRLYLSARQLDAMMQQS